MLTPELTKGVNNNLAYFHFAPAPSYLKTQAKITNPKLSIVIPVYNGALYITRLIRSIQYQTIHSLEIILVDDASTDNTLDVMNQLQAEDNRIKIIKNKINRGCLYSRIYGGLQSTGEYITYMDHDDLYSSVKILEQAYTELTKNGKVDFLKYDIFGGNYIKDVGFITHAFFATRHEDKINRILHQPVILENFFHNYDEDNLVSGISYDKIYSRELFNKMVDTIGEKMWNSHQTYMEDFLIAYAAALNAKTFYYLSYAGPWHWYNNKEGLTLTTFDNDGKKLDNYVESNKKIGNYFDIVERCFDISENYPEAEIFRDRMIDLLIKDQNLKGISLSYHYERLLVLLRRFYNWKYTSKKMKTKIENYAKNIIQYNIDYKKKYYEFYN